MALNLRIKLLFFVVISALKSIYSTDLVDNGLGYIQNIYSMSIFGIPQIPFNNNYLQNNVDASISDRNLFVLSEKSVVEGGTYDYNLNLSQFYYFRKTTSSKTLDRYIFDSSFFSSQINLPDPAGPITLSGGGTYICADGISILTFSVDPIPNATTYEWTAPAGFEIQGNQNEEQITYRVTKNAISGVIQVKGINDLGSGQTNSYSLTINPLPSATFDLTETISIGQTILIGPAVNSSFNYSWSISSSASILSNASQLRVSPTVNTTYSLTIQDKITQCEETYAINVFVKNPSVTSISPGTYCLDIENPPVITISGNDFDELSGVLFDNYVVTDYSKTSNLITINSLPDGATASGFFTLIFGDFSKVFDEFILPVLRSPSGAGPINGDTNVCAGSTMRYIVPMIDYASDYIFEASPAANILINHIPGNNFVDVTFGPNSPNVITLSVKGINSCDDGASSALDINVSSLPSDAGNISIINGSQNICPDGTRTLALSVPAINNATSYQWIAPQGFDIQSGGNTEQIVFTITQAAQTGNIQVRGVNACGEGVFSPNFPITINNIPPFTFDNIEESICIGQSVVLGPLETISGYSYSWKISGTSDILHTLKNYEVSPNEDTNYQLTIRDIVTGCELIQQFSVYVDSSAPEIGIINGDSVVCKGSDNRIFSVEGPENLDYIWTLPQGASLVNGQGTKEVIVNFSNQAQNGVIKVTGVNACGVESDDATFPVTIDDVPVAPQNLNATNRVCKLDQITISVDPVPGKNFTWYIPAGFNIIGTNDSNQLQLEVTERAVSGNISVGINYSCGVGPLTSQQITVNELPVAEAGNDISICLDTSATIGSNGNGYVSYSWVSFPSDQASISNPSIPNPRVSPSQTTRYVLTVVDNNGCEDTDEVIVTVLPKPSATLITNSAICINETISLGERTVDTNNYTWTSTSGDIPIGPNFEVTPTSTTTYYLTETNPLTGCIATNEVTITVAPTPVITTGPDTTICEDEDYNIAASGANYNSQIDPNTIVWSLQLASGQLNEQSTIYTPNAADVARGYFILKYTGQGLAPCEGTYSDLVRVDIIKNPTVAINSVDAICEGETISLNAITTNASGITWTFPGRSVSGTNYTYTPTSTDISNGSVVISVTAAASSPCADSATVSKTINISRKPTVFAGSRFSSCSVDGIIDIDANNVSVTNAAGIEWSIISGSGTLTNERTESPSYMPSTADYANGSVTLRLTAFGIAPCDNNNTSDLIIDLFSAPEVNAGSDTQICASDNYTISDAAPVNAANILSYRWTIESGPGSILAGTEDQLNPIFVPANNLTTPTQTILKLVARPKAPCVADASDTMIITTYPVPVVNAGTDASICVSDSSPLTYSLSAATVSTNYAGLVWSSSGTGSFSNQGALNPTYSPSAEDIENGSVILKLTVNQDNCSPVEDTMLLYITKELTVFAGSSGTICAGDSFDVTNATSSNPNVSYSWEIITNGVSGVLENYNTLLPTFVSTTSDSGVVRLRLTVTPQSGSVCSTPKTSEVDIIVNPAPTAEAGPTHEICEGQTVNLTGATATNYESILWTTDGDGTFISENNLKPIYTPGSNDIASGGAILTMTVSGRDGCTDTQDTTIVQITRKPEISIVPAVIEVCEDLPSYSFNPSEINGQDIDTYLWSTNSNGSFNSTENIAEATYTFSQDDINAGQVVLNLTATNGNSCNQQSSDQVVIKFIRNPEVSTGENPEVSFCTDLTFYSINNATYSNASSIVWSSASSGSSGFSAPTELITNYTPNATDIANGSVVLTLTGQSKAGCTETATASFTLIIEPAPVITVPLDNPKVCSGDSYTISGVSIENEHDPSSIRLVSRGSGTFNNNRILNAIYTPSDQDVENGSVTIDVLVSPNSSCNSIVTNSFTIDIIKAPTVDITLDRKDVCEGPVSFNGLLDSGGDIASYSWVALDGNGSFNSSNIASPIYTPDASDYDKEYITLQVTAYPTSPCSTPAIDTIKIYFNKQPKILSLSHDEVCASDEISFILNSNFRFENAASHSFTTDDGAVINGTSSSVTIIPNAAAILQGYADIELSLVPLSPCETIITQTLRVAIQKVPNVVASVTNAVICEGETISTAPTTQENIDLSTIQWSASSGANSGVFASDTSLVTTYIPSNTDISNGYVELTITANGIGPCAADEISDTIRININKAPVLTLQTVSASRTICQNQAYTVNDGDFTRLENYTSIAWNVISGEVGNLANSNTKYPTYTASPDDLNLPGGKVILEATVQGLNGCSIAVDRLEITVKPIATLSIPDPNVEVCVNGSVLLEAIATNYIPSSILWTKLSGNGSLLNGDTLNPTFVSEASTTQTIYKVRVISEDPCNTPIERTVTITASPINTPTIGITQDYLCAAPGAAYNITTADAVNPNSVEWRTSGTGVFSDFRSINPVYTPSSSDILAGSVVLTLTGINGPGCDLNSYETATVNLVFQTPPTASFLSLSEDVCLESTYILNDLTAIDYNTINWVVIGGNGTLRESNTENPEYDVAANDPEIVYLKGTITGLNGCDPIVITKTLNIRPKVSNIDIGLNRTICSGETVSFSPSILPLSPLAYSEITWSSSGDGTWSPSNKSLNATYIPGTADEANNTPINITLTVTPLVSCDSGDPNDYPKATITLNINDPVTVNAGPDISVCENEEVVLSGAQVFLNGVVDNSKAVYWTASSTGGNFSASNRLETTYTLSQTDKANGFVTLTLHAASEAPCPEVIDEILVTVDKAPVAIAGAARNNVCQGSTIIINDAQAENGDIKWFIQAAPGYSLAAGTQVLNDTSATPSVVIGEQQQGNLILKLRVTPEAGTSCDGATPVESELIINIQEKPSITEIGSGPERKHCEDTTTYVGRNINVSNAKELVWTSSGSGSFINGSETTQTPQYNPSDEDYTNGNVVLTLRATPRANCSTDVTYDLTLNLIKNPQITLAQSTLEVCQDFDSPSPIILDGVSYNDVVVSYQWDSSGTGTFSSETAPNPTYTPSQADISKGQITLVVVAIGNNTCTSYITSRNITINIDQIPEISIISLDEVCEGENISLLTTPSNSVEWGIEAGKGSVSSFDDTSSQTPTYIPTQADIDRGEVALKVRYVSDNSCGNGTWITKTIKIQKKPSGVFNLGDSQVVCTSEDSVGIDVTIQNTSTFTWSHNGFGTWVFLNPNDPDIVYTPATADYGKTLIFELTLNPIGGCSDNVKISHEVFFVAAPTADAGADFSSCGTQVRLLNSSSSSSSKIEWLTSGNGTFISTNTSDPSSYTYLPSQTDLNSGSVVLTLKAYPAGGCSDTVSDSITVTLTEPLSLLVNNPTINLCENISYTFKNSDYSVATGSYNSGEVIWNVISGDGNLLNERTLYPTYVPGPGDTNNSVILKLSMTGVGDCLNDVSEQFTIDYTASPEVIAGPSQTICASNSEVFLNEAIASPGLIYKWSTDGDGEFIADNILNARYIPGATDKSKGIVVLTLTGTSQAPCNTQDSSEIIINIKPEASLELPSNLIFCPGEPIQLNANGNFTSIVWSHNGSGSLNNNTDRNPIYTLAPGQNSETIVFTAVASLTGSSCSAVIKQVTVSVNQDITVDAGNDIVLCNTDTSITINNASKVIGTGNFIWSLPQNSDGILTNATSLNPTYTPGPNDRSNGSVRLSLTATRGGVCPDSDTDFVDIILPATPVVEAGTPKTSCGLTPVPLNDATVNYTSNVYYKWVATNGTGNFDDNTKLNAVYTPSNLDLLNGDPIILRLTATLSSNGCDNSVSDTVVLNISGNITVNAGADFATCSSGTFNLVGTITNGSPTSTVWSTIAGGNFGENQLNPSYTPTASDIAAGEVIFRFSAYDNAGCTSGAFDTVRVTFEETPELKIGTGSSSIEICSTQNTIFLNGSSNNPLGITNYRWSNNSSSGIFISGQNSLNPTYQFSSAEKLQGSVVLTLYADGVMPCNSPAPVNVTIQINAPLNGSPNISGPTNICKDNTLTHSYQAENVIGADSYNWTVPAGVDIISGQGTRNIIVRYPEIANSGEIRVVAENSCGASTTGVLNVTTISKLLGSLSGPETICPGATETYTASDVTGAKFYTWNYSGTGANIIGAANTKQIQVQYSNTSTSGSWTVYATLDCGNTNSLTKNIVVNPKTELDLISSNIPNSICSGLFNQNLVFNSTISSLNWERTINPGVFPTSNFGSGNIQDNLVNKTNTDIVVTYQLDYLDSNNCPGTTSFNVTVQPEIKLTSPLTYPVCSGDPIEYTYQNNAQGVTYTARRSLPPGVSSNNNSNTITGAITETLTNSNNTPTDVEYTISQNLNGCSTVVEKLKITVAPKLKLTSGYTDTACEGESYNYTISSSPTFNSVRWTSSTGLVGYTSNISEIITGDVTYIIELQTSDGCVSTEVLEVTMKEGVDFNLPVNQSVCSGDTFSYTIDNTADSYSWTRPLVSGIAQGAITIASKYINEVLTNTTPNPINVPYTYTLTKDGCTYEDTFEVIVLPNIEVTSSLNETHCSDSTFIYTIESNIPGATYSWSRAAVSGINSAGDTNSDTTAQINEALINNTTTNKTVVYEIIVTKDGCNSDIQRLEVVVSPLNIFTQENTIETPYVLCSGESLTKVIQSNIPGSFNWIRNAVPGVSNAYVSELDTNIINETLINIFDVPVIVTYEITPINSQGCINEPQFFFVEVLPTPKFTNTTLNPTEYCSMSPITHTLETNLDSNETVTYTWERTLPNGITSVENPQKNYSGTGNIIETLRNTSSSIIEVPYTIRASVDGYSCPEVVATISIPILPEPILIEQDYVGCSGGNLKHKLQSNVNANYVWKRIPDIQINNGQVFTGNGQFIDEILTSTSTDVVDVIYEITITELENGCTSKDTITVKLYPNINFDSASSLSICSDQILDYTISTDTNINPVSDPNSKINYVWNRPFKTGILQPESSGYTERIFEKLTNTTDKPLDVIYRVTAIYDFDYYNNGPRTGQCHKSFDLVVTVYPTTDVSQIVDQTVCNGDTLNYSLTSNTPGTAFTWNVIYPQGVTATAGTSGTNLINGTFSHDFDTDVVLNYLVTANSNNCSSVTKTLKVTVPPKPVLRNTPSADPICSGTNFEFVPNLNVNTTKFIWTRPLVSGLFNRANTGEGTISEDLVLSGTSSATVTYTYVLENIQGCIEDSGFFTVTVVPGVTIDVTDQSEVCNIPSNVNIPLSSNYVDANFKWSRTLPSGVVSDGKLAFYESGPNQNTIQETIINNTPTTQSVFYTITATRAGVCESIKQIEVKVSPKIKLISASEDYVCSGDPLNYTISTNVPTTYTWTRGANSNIITTSGNTGSGSTISDVLVNTSSVTQEMVYTITATTNAGTICSETFIFTARVAPSVEIDSSLSESVCSGPFTYTITTGNNQPNTTYSWTRATVPGIQAVGTNGNSATINESLINTTPDPVEVKYLLNAVVNGCAADSKELSVIVYPTTDVSSIVDQVACNGEIFNYELTGSTPNTTFSWNVSYPTGVTSTASTSGTDIINGQFSHDFNYPITLDFLITANANSCSAVTKTLRVTIPPKIILQNKPVNQSICSGSTFNFVPALNVNSTKFKWTRVLVGGVLNTSNYGEGNISEDLVLSGTSSAPVTYTYVLENIEGCIEESGSFTVTVVPGVTINVPDQSEICNTPSNVNIPLSSNYPNTNFKWSRTLPLGIESTEYSGTYESGLGQTAIQETLINNTNSTLTVFYKITADRQDACGTTKLIAQPVSPKIKLISASEDYVCSGDPLNYTISTNVPTTYTWTRGTNSNISTTAGTTGSGTTISDVLVNNSSVTQDIVYTITATTNAGTICSETFTFTAKVAPSVEINSSLSESVCSGPFTYTITTGNNQPNTTYSWSRAIVPGIQAIAQTRNSATINESLINTTSDPIEVKYLLNASVNGCDAETKVLLVLVYPKAEISSVNYIEACSGELFDFTFTSFTPGTTFEWKSLSGFSGLTPNSYDQTGTLKIEETFKNDTDYPVDILYQVTPKYQGCDGVPQNLRVRVMPTPRLTNPPEADLVICSGSSPGFIPNVSTASTFYWSRPNVVGIGSGGTSGEGIINDPLINTDSKDVIVTYTYVLVTPGGCTSQSNTFDVVVKPNLEIDAQAVSTELCDGEVDNLEIYIIKPITGANYTWSRTLPSGVTSSTKATTSNSNPITDGRFSETLINNSFETKEVRYTIKGELGDCTSSKVLVVNVLPSPRVISPLIYNVCSGTEFEYSIIAPGATGFNWTYNSSTNNNITGYSAIGQGSQIRETLTNTSAQTQKVIYTITPVINGCEGRNSFELEVYVAPEITFDYSEYDEICSGENVSFDHSRITPSNYTFTWTRANTPGILEGPSSGTGLNINNEVLTNTTNNVIPVTYKLVISYGSCKEEVDYTVIVNPSATMTSASVVNLCSGDFLDYTIISDANSATWTRNDDPNIQGNSKNILDGPFVNYSDTENIYTYTINLNGNSNNCSGTATLKVIVQPEAQLISDQVIEVCSGTEFTYTPISNLNGATVTWSRQLGAGIEESPTSGTGNIVDILTAASGVTTTTSAVYDITFTKNNCSTTRSVTVNVINQPQSVKVISNGNTIDIESTTSICSGEELVVQPVADNISNFLFKRWYRDEVNGISNTSNSGFGPSPISERLINDSTNPVEVVYRIVMGNTNCELEFTHKVIVHPSISLTKPSDISNTFQQICVDEQIIPITYTVNGQLASYNLELFVKNVSGWSPVSATNFTITNNNNNLSIHGYSSSSGLFKYKLSVTGQCIDSDGKATEDFEEGTIEVIGKPTISLSANSPGVENQNICIGEEIDNIILTIQGLAQSDEVIVDNLPPGIGYVFVPGTSGQGILTIQGTPTALQNQNEGGNIDSTFKIRTTLSCDNTPFQGNLVISSLPELNLTSEVSTLNQSVCSNSDIVPITYKINTSNASIVWTSNNAPSGISLSIAGDIVTIKGKPVALATSETTYNFEILLTGGTCDSELFPGGSITVYPELVIDETLIDSNLDSCSKSERFIDISGAISTISNNLIIEWSGPGGYKNNLQKITNLDQGVYFLKLTNKITGCVSDPIEFNVEPKTSLGVTATITNAGCQNEPGKIQLEFSGIIGNIETKWEKLSGSSWIAESNTGFIFSGPEGIYRVTIWDRGEGACSEPITRIYEIKKGDAEITILNKQHINCPGVNDGSFTFSITSQIPIQRYDLYNASSQLAVNDATYDITSQGVAFKNLSPGDYYVAALDLNGCYYLFNQEDDIVTIETLFTDPLSISSIDIKNSTCYGEDNGSINISVEGGVKFDSTSTEYIFSWEGYNTVGEIIFRQNSEDVYNLPPGKYSLTITDAVGCQLGPIEYEINEPEEIKITQNIQDIDCDNPYGKVDFNISGGLAPYGFKLFYLDPIEDRKVEIQDVSNYFNIRDLNSGIYIIEVSDRYCKVSKTFEIKDLTDLKIDKVNISSEICSLEPGYIYLETVTNSNNPQLSFYYNDVIINSENISKVSSNRYRLYIAEPQEQFVLKIGDNLGCFSQEYFVDTRIEISEISYTSEMFEKTGEYRVNDPIVFNTNYIVDDIPRVEDNRLLYDFVTWDFGDFGFKKFTFADNQLPNDDNESINQVFHSYTANGVYEVSHKVYSIYGCFKETKFTIRIGSGYEIIIPNAFTPNNDGINDYFRPVVGGIESLSIQVYDQWGNVVHFSSWEMNNLDATWGWNGVENKQSTPTSGTYNYNIVAKTIDGETVTRYGSVFIIK